MCLLVIVSMRVVRAQYRLDLARFNVAGKFPGIDAYDIIGEYLEPHLYQEKVGFAFTHKGGGNNNTTQQSNKTEKQQTNSQTTTQHHTQNIKEHRKHRKQTQLNKK